MEYTVSIHNGKKVNKKHNRREKGAVEKANRYDESNGIEPHIKENGHYEIWKDIPTNEALHLLLDEAIEAYNKGKKPSRKTTFEKEISKFLRKKNTCIERETILQIGNAGNAPSENECKRLLRALLYEWQKNNPNMFVTSVCLHDDEASMHLHVVYIPFHKKREGGRGIEVQLGMKGALEDMGYRDTPECSAFSSYCHAMHAMKERFLIGMGYGFKGAQEKEKKETPHIDPPVFKKTYNMLLEVWNEMNEKSDKYLLSLFAKKNIEEFEKFEAEYNKSVEIMAKKEAQKIKQKELVRGRSR